MSKRSLQKKNEIGTGGMGETFIDKIESLKTWGCNKGVQCK